MDDDKTQTVLALLWAYACAVAEYAVAHPTRSNDRMDADLAELMNDTTRRIVAVFDAPQDERFVPAD